MEPSPLAARLREVSASSVGIDFPSLAVQPWEFQRQDIAIMLAQRWAYIFSDVGTGKTLLGIGAISFLKDRSRLAGGALVLMPKMGGVLLEQWGRELARFAPGLRVGTVLDCRSAAEREEVYRSRWDVLLVNYEAFRRDHFCLQAVLGARGPALLFCDEASVFRNSSAQISRAIRQIAHLFEFRFAVTGTPIQTRLEDLWGISFALRMEEIVGSKKDFLERYVVRRRRPFWISRGGVRRRCWKTEVVGYRNVSELRERLRPWVIRRTLSEPEVGRHIPEVVPFVVRVPLTDLQAAVYRRLARSQRLEPGSAFNLYQERLAVADGLRTYDADMSDSSAKSSWFMEALDTQLANEKVVVFSRFVRSIWPLVERLRRRGVEYELYIGGGHQSRERRAAGFRRFQEDPGCRVLIATQAMEMGVDLGTARVMVFYSSLPNPARMEQLLGRIRRAGNPFPKVVAVTLLSKGTVEEAVYDSLIARNAIREGFLREDSVLYESLSARDLVRFMREDSAA